VIVHLIRGISICHSQRGAMANLLAVVLLSCCVVLAQGTGYGSYGLFFDAGSSGTSVHAYSFGEHKDGKPDCEQIMESKTLVEVGKGAARRVGTRVTFDRLSHAGLDIEPGLSSFSDNLPGSPTPPPRAPPRR